MIPSESVSCLSTQAVGKQPISKITAVRRVLFRMSAGAMSTTLKPILEFCQGYFCFSWTQEPSFINILGFIFGVTTAVFALMGIATGIAANSVPIILGSFGVLSVFSFRFIFTGFREFRRQFKEECVKMLNEQNKRQ